jgi:hypothetical protein
MSVNLEQAFRRFERRLTIRLFWMMLGVKGLMQRILFAVLRFVD